MLYETARVGSFAFMTLLGHIWRNFPPCISYKLSPRFQRPTSTTLGPFTGDTTQPIFKWGEFAKNGPRVVLDFTLGNFVHVHTLLRPRISIAFLPNQSIEFLVPSLIHSSRLAQSARLEDLHPQWKLFEALFCQTDLGCGFVAFAGLLFALNLICSQNPIQHPYFPGARGNHPTTPKKLNGTSLKEPGSQKGKHKKETGSSREGGGHVYIRWMSISFRML